MYICIFERPKMLFFFAEIINHLLQVQFIPFLLCFFADFLPNFVCPSFSLFIFVHSVDCLSLLCDLSRVATREFYLFWNSAKYNLGLVMDESLVIKDPFLNEELCEDLRQDQGYTVFIPFSPIFLWSLHPKKMQF